MAATRAPEKAATGESPRPSLSPRGLRSRAAIVDAAATMMRQSGVASTSLDDVLAAAGCGKSQLYHYFDDRADLIRAVIDPSGRTHLGGATSDTPRRLLGGPEAVV